MDNLSHTCEVPRKLTRVLIVEDDANTASLMAELLEGLDCQTLVAGEGLQACCKAPEFNPDIVLLDIDLPDMNGYEVAQRLRRSPSFSSVLIIALTAHNEPEDRQKAYHAGMDLHLAKPLQVNFFKELINAFGKTLRRWAPAPL